MAQVFDQSKIHHPTGQRICYNTLCCPGCHNAYIRLYALSILYSLEFPKTFIPQIGTSDTIFNGRRWPPILFGAVSSPLSNKHCRRHSAGWGCNQNQFFSNFSTKLSNIVCGASLLAWDIPRGWKWFCYIYSGAGYGLSGLCMA